MFHTRKKPVVEDGYGRLYVLKFELDNGVILHKVGMCSSNRTVDRMMEILRSYFMVYRVVPKVTLRKDKKVVVPLLVEKHLHSLLADWNFRFDKKFDGSTEFFTDIDEEVLLDYIDKFDYRELLRVKKMKSLDYNDITKELKKIAGKDSDFDEGIDELPF